MNARAWAAFAAVSVLWGMPYLFIRVAVDGGMPPLFLAWTRLALSGVIVTFMAWRAGTLPSVRRRWGPLLAFAIAELVFPFPLIAFGETRVASSLAAIIVAAVPLLIALLALRFEPSERVDRRRLAGLITGFAGVVALVGVDIAGSGSELVGAGAILVAAFGYACGPMLFKRYLADIDARASTGVALAIAGLILTPAGLLDLPSHTPSAAALIGLVVLIIFCTVAAFIIYMTLVRDIGPGRAAVITYVAPILAVALGMIVLGEHPGAGAIGGLLLILAGSWLATGGGLPPRRRRTPVAVEREAAAESVRA